MQKSIFTALSVCTLFYLIDYTMFIFFCACECLSNSKHKSNILPKSKHALMYFILGLLVTNQI